jgi:hypothetical protein
MIGYFSFPAQRFYNFFSELILFPEEQADYIFVNANGVSKKDEHRY